MTDFLVRRDDLTQTEVREEAPAELAEGEARMRVEKFGLSSNNITYAVIGDTLRYWELFPAPEGWGRIPAWGIAEVVESRAPGVEPGTRVFGLVPMSDTFVARPVPRGGGLEDTAEHRAPLARAYNRYLPPPDVHEDAQLVFRPLFGTSLVIAEWLAERNFDDAEQVLLSSASSKTAYGLAHLLAGRVDVVGLTSERNRAFVEGLGTYDAVASYDEIAGLATIPTAFVDFAGNADVRAAVHKHFGEALHSSTGVGLTHGAVDPGAPADLPGPQPHFFFAPLELERRAKEWGASGLEQRYREAWAGFAPRLQDGWLDLQRASGTDALREIYLELLDGSRDPRRGDVVSL